MTVKLLAQWGEFPAGSLFSSTAQTEASLVTAKVATTDLADGVPWNPPKGQPGEIARINERLVSTIRSGRSSVIGDSINAYGAASLFNNLCIRSGGMMRRANNAAVAGQTSSAMVARIATDVPKTAKLDSLLIMAGTNDHANGIATAVTVRNVIGMARYAQSIGIDPIIALLPPRSDTTAQRDQSAARRSALREACAVEGLVVIDPWVNFVAGDGGWIPGASPDGVHGSADTAAAAAVEAWSQLSLYVRRGWDGLHAMLGVPGGLISTNGFFEDTNADGMPDNWSSYGGLVVTRSTATGRIGNTWRISTNGLNAGGTPVIDIHVHERTVSGLTLASGDRIAIAAKASLSGWSSGLRLTVRANPSGGANAIGLEPTGGAGDFTDGVLWAESVINASGSTSIVFQVTLQASTTTPSVGFAELSQLQVWNLTQMGLA